MFLHYPCHWCDASFQAGWRINGVITPKVSDIRSNTGKFYKLSCDFCSYIVLFSWSGWKPFFEEAFCSNYCAVHLFLNADEDTWWWDNILPLIFDCSLDLQYLMRIYYSWYSSSICDPFNNGFGSVVFIALYCSFLSFGWLRINWWSHNSMMIPWVHWIHEGIPNYFVFHFLGDVGNTNM